MEQTSRLSIVVDASNAEANIERLRTSLRNLSQDAINASQRLRDIARHNPFGGLNPQTIQSINNFNRLNQTINNNSTAFNNFSRTINNTNNHFVRMGDTINRNVTIINQYNNSVNNTHNALSRLQGLLAGGMFTMMGLNILKTADAMQSLDSQIKLVTKSEEEYLTVRQKVREIADKNYADIEATTNLYQNSARALANLGKTQQEALVFTNAVSLAMRTGGKSALEQKSALYQLGQAMQSGVLNGDEFRSISENAPILLDLVAKKLNVTRGEVKELASEGKITSQVIYETLANATPMLEEMAKKMPVTMGQAFALVRNKYKEFIGDFMNNDTGLSGVIAKSLVVGSNHFNTFAKVAVAGAGVAMLSFTNRVLASGTALTKLATIMKAHPIFTLASVVMAVSVANRGLDETLNDLNKTLSVFGMMIKDTVNLFGELGGTAYAIFQDITSSANDSTKQSSQLFGGFFSDVGSGFTGLVNGTAKTFDAMATAVKTFGKFAGENIAYFVTNTGNLFKLMANNIAHVFENIVNNVINNSVNFIINRVNDVIDFTNNASGLLGIDPMQKLTPFESKFSVGRFQVGNIVATRSWQELFDENAKSQIQNGALSYVNGLYSATNALPPSANLNNPMGEYQKPKDKDKDKKKKDLLSGEIAQAIMWLSDKYKLNPNDLSAVISFETGGTFSTNKRNPKSSATGLIQFMHYSDGTGSYKTPRKNWDYYGMSRDQFGALSPMEQMRYVDRFFQSKKLRQGASLAEIYDAVAGYGYKRGSKAYKDNRIWDVDGDGVVRKGEAVKSPKFKPHIKNYFPSGLDLQAVGKAMTDVAKSDSQNAEQQQKNYNDLISQLLKNPLERLNDELKIQIDAIHANTIATTDEKQRMIERATQMSDGKASAMKAEAILQYQGHQLTDEEKADYEFQRDVGNFWANPNADLSQAEAYIKSLERAKDIKREIAFIDNAERELEANRHKMTPKEILDTELSIDFRRKVLSGEYTEEQLDSIKELYSKQVQAQDKVDEHKRKSLKFEIEQYNMNVFQKIEAERQLAHLQLETSEQMNITELAWHKEAIDAKYDYEVKKAKEARDKIFNDAKNDYARQIHLLQNPKDPYAGVRYDLKNDKENKYTDEEIAKHIEMLKKQKQLSDYVQAQERYGMAKFAPTEHKDYWGALKGVAEMGQQILGDYGLYKDQHKNEKNYLKEQLDASLITEEEYHAKREEMAKRHHEAMALFAINGTSGILTNMAQMAKYTIGEQSKTYRTLYQMGKAFALAQAGIAVYKAGADAWANETGTVWQKAVASALAVAKTSQFVQLISSANPQGFATGGYTGDIGTSQIAGVVHGQEYVLNAKATKRIGVDTLNRLNKGDSIGGGVNVVINNYSNETATAEQAPNGDIMVTIGKVAKQIAQNEIQQYHRNQFRQGGAHYGK